MALTKVTGDFIKDGVLTQAHLHTSHGITTAHIGEGSNLYFTNARVASYLSSNNYVSGTGTNNRLAIWNGTGVIDSDSDFYVDGDTIFTTNLEASGSLNVSGGNITLGGTGRIQGIDTVSANTDAANKLYVDNQVAGIVNSAPSTLDTLNELAAALGDDPNFAATTANSIGNKMPLAGGTFTGNVTFNDSVKARFGNSSDMQIYHDGSHSYIDNGANDFYLRTTGNGIFFKNIAGGGNEHYAKFISNGAVELYHDAVKKLETTSAGVSVTGNVYATSFVGNAAIVNQVTAATSGGDIKFKNNAGTDKVFITDAGNVGIGGGITVSSPGSSFYTTFKSANDYVIGLKDSANTTQWWLKAYTNGGFALHEDNVGDKFTIAAGGNATFAGIVGMGSTGIYAGTNAQLNLPGRGIAIKNDKNGSNNNWSYIYNTATTSGANIEFQTGSGIALTLNHDKSATFAGDITVSGGDITLGGAGRIIQSQHSTTLGNSSYVSEAAVTAQATNTTNAYPGYGFHKAGQLGLFLYATDRSTLRQRGDDGTDVAIWNTGDFSSTNVSNWNTAYGWGNHASAGYFTNSGSWLGDLGSYSYTREHGIQMTGGSEFVLLSKSGQGHVLIDGHYMSYEAGNGFFGSYNSSYGNLTGIRASAANTLKVMQLDGGNAILEVTQDVRAPIFYDLNDTGRYCDPNGTSFFTGLTVSNTINGTVASSLRLTREDNRTISPSELPAGQLKFGFTSWNNNNGSPYADFLHMRSYTDSSGGNDTLLMVKKANPSGVRVWNQSWGSSTAYGNYIDLIDTGSNNQVKTGYIQSNASLRAPIFYDSNDTNYYINPASNSVVNSINGFQTTTTGGASKLLATAANGYLYLNNWIYVDGAGLFSSVNGAHFYPNTSSDYGTWRVNGTRNSWSGITFDVSGTNVTLMASTVTMGFYNDADNEWMVESQRNSSTWLYYNGTWELKTNAGSGEARAQMRAPIFYDSNDTSYYLDPNSTTSLRTVGSWRSNSSTWDGEFAGKMQYHSNYWYIQTTNGVFIRNASGANNVTLAANGVCTAVNDWRAPQFYDSADTNYYLNPNGNSILNTANFATVQISNGQSYNENIRMFPGSNGYSSLVLGAAAGSSGSGNGQWTFVRYPSSSAYKFTIRHNSIDHVTIATAGNVTNHVDTRSPIFYDSDSTSHYIHPGNVSNLSGLNIQYGNIDLRYANTIDMTGSSYNQNTYYPVRIYVSDITRIRIENRLNAGGTHPGWATHSSGFSLLMDWYTNGSGWGTVGVTRTIRQWNEAWTNVTICGGITQMTNSSAEVVWLRGGGKYLIKTSFNNTVQVQTSAYTSNSQTVTPTTSIVNDVWSAASGSFSAGGDVYAGNSYATEFYDRDDTTYYGNFGSTGTSLKVKGTAEFSTSAGNLRGYIRATDTNDEHFIIATSGGEDIAFKDGGTSGSTNMIIRGDGDVLTTRNHYAQTFYDSNNSAYYVNPASTSVISGLTMAGALQTAGSHTVGSGGTSNIYMGGVSGNHFRFHIHNGVSYFDMNSGTINWRQGSSTRYYFYPSTANMTINGTLTQYSDIRYKENIVEIPDAIDKVKSIRGVYYNRTDFNTEPTKIGVIAQEVEVLMPELILQAEDTDMKSVSYNELTAVLVQAIKEQQAIIDDLKSRIETLENQ